MRRDSRQKRSKSVNDKIIMYSGVGVVILAIIVVALVMYNKNLGDDIKDETMSLEEMAKITGNYTDNSESASTEIGKTVEESKNEMARNSVNQINSNIFANNTTNNTTNINNTTSNTVNNTSKNTTKNVNNNTSKTNAVVTNTNDNKKTETPKKELEFQKPVDGEIVREYAKDNLIYSETLKEWTTHVGIDIKADKTTVVKSSEAGTVKSIKNDPRYGLTVVIEHDDGYQTVYANLLTSEFVVEGEKVDKGQSIGTVGNTAVFESADEPHLHFEILKDSIQVDPCVYIK